jgi:2-polyprenyl-3-methyl-5-hydroxy-6-metoxy-1,4-benzoquinol methylase
MSFLDLYHISGEDGREDMQSYWHNFIVKHIKNSTVLDVGAGLGGSRKRLEEGGNTVFTQEPGPELPADFKQDISEIEDSAFDYVTNFDVIEHVEKDEEFLGHLFRVAKKGVFIATPNFHVSQNRNPYHVREYTPTQFVNIGKKFTEKMRCFCDGGSGIEVEFDCVGHHFVIKEIIELPVEEFLNTHAPHLGILFEK